ncbi:MAG: ParB/RepB/Spo0J family partition protein [Clostridia bacterium]|nr:ParB/RepB/Spo0J family partition protein [Clostridia bacterium]MBR6564833.1 ParB/RepB/Spo0J family partition protein [Clostridia bacterium]
MAAVKKGGLGRGLDALFNENATDEKGVVTLRLSEIEPNRNQPRTSFDEDALIELADSIQKHGLIQPIVVRPTSSGVYQIVAGERRWRACRMADLQEVPVVIKELDDQKYYEVALIENLQREDLNAVEEAQGYKTLIDVYSLTQEQVAESVGKSRSAVTNALRLLNLNDKALEALKNGDITAGHARAILAADSDEIATEMLKAALAGASVRELEAMTKSKPKAAKKAPNAKNNFYSEVEISLKNELGRKVSIKSKGKGKGTITLEFYSDEELADFARKLSE